MTTTIVPATASKRGGPASCGASRYGMRVIAPRQEGRGLSVGLNGTRHMIQPTLADLSEGEG